MGDDDADDAGSTFVVSSTEQTSVGQGAFREL